MPQPCPVLPSPLSKIIETYDGNGDGICETIEVAKWLVDCYRAMNKSFQPTATDIASYVQIIDKNRNGKVTRDELEEFIIRYFFNPNRVA
jgi:Ca2+-binding EF-hand superfamily protein